MTKTFEAQATAFITVESATDDDATKLILDWQNAVTAGSYALSEFEKTSEILSVEFAIEDVEEVKAPGEVS